MKLTLVVVTLVLSVTLARADTKSAWEARRVNLNQPSNISVTSGIGPGASTRKARDAPTKGDSNPHDHLTR
jgi:hypothetical protein